MKIVEAGKKYLAMLGIGPDHRLKTVKLLFATVVYITNVGGNLGFFFYDAKTSVEYANSIFITATITMVAACFVILASQNPLIIAVIDLGDILVMNSEFQSISFFLANRNRSISQKHKIYRNEISNLEIHVPGNKSCGRKMVRISVLGSRHVDASCLGFSKSHVHLLRLLYHGCGQRCIRFTIFHVVGLEQRSFSFEFIIDFRIFSKPKGSHSIGEPRPDISSPSCYNTFKHSILFCSPYLHFPLELECS